MILILKASASEAEIARVLRVAGRFPGVEASVRAATDRTRGEVHVFGDTLAVATATFAGLPGVDEVVRLGDRWPAIARRDPTPIGFSYGGLRFGDGELHVFAGLCAVDGRESVEQTFAALRGAGLRTARAGVYKPRTSPYDFQGLGKDCLPYVFELAAKHDIAVLAMEVTRELHVDEILEARMRAGVLTGVMLQIGARNAQNFELLKHVGRQHELPVLVKRGLRTTLRETLSAIEYVAAGGNERVSVCLRGVASELGAPHRNLVDFSQVSVLRRLTRLPVCIDPSHAVGAQTRGVDGIGEIHHATAQGVIAGAHMILVDVHPDPERALCDGPQALSLDELPRYLADVALVRRTYEERVRLHSDSEGKRA